MFNNYFGSVFTVEDLRHTPDVKKVMYDKPIIDAVFSEKGVLDLWLRNNPTKLPGLDNIHPQVLEECAKALQVHCVLCSKSPWTQ